ncbi:MAG: hypothetical protein WCD12_22515 [Candidatus Binatus sp.]|jgi:hypothetical protein|uniref:hypothetical protein n=1 Tax=Candidatus Binatus sp. TaxID=2811406 RepID=UPI003C7377DE
MSDKEVEERVYELYKLITGAPRGSVESERAELKALMHNGDQVSAVAKGVARFLIERRKEKRRKLVRLADHRESPPPVKHDDDGAARKRRIAAIVDGHLREACPKCGTRLVKDPADAADPDQDDRKERLAKLIRENVRPKESHSAFDVVALLAPLDAERLRLIADVFVAMHPDAPGAKRREAAKATSTEAKRFTTGEAFSFVIKALERQGIRLWFPEDRKTAAGSVEGRLHDVLIRIEEALGEKSLEYIRANERAHDAAIERRREEGRENDTRESLRDLEEWADVLIAELKSRNKPAPTPRRRRRKRSSSKPSNVVPFKRAAKEAATVAQDGDPKAAS